jgi:hypothetical protein
MLTQLVLAAVGASCFFLLGAWFGHRAGGRAQEAAERHLARVLLYRVRVECPGHHATAGDRDPRADYGAALLIDATVAELMARGEIGGGDVAPPSDPMRRRVEDLQRWGGAITDRVCALERGPAARDALTLRVLEMLELLPEKWPDDDDYHTHAALCAGLLGGLRWYARSLGLLAREVPA